MMVKIRIILVFIILLFLNKPSFADNFQSGVDAYKSKDFQSALTFFSTSVQEDGSTSLNLYFLGLTLKNLGQQARAQKAFNAALKLKPSGELLKKINQELSSSQPIKLSFSEQLPPQVQQAKSSNSSLPNYLDQAVLEGQIVRWDLSKMPLQVYIESPSNVNGYSPEFRNYVVKAVKAWETATKSKIRFVFVSDSKNANIKITWKDKFEGEKIGESPFVAVNNTILKSDIVLSTTMPDGKNKLPTEIYSVSLHEMGHALGIKGHSPYNKDVMYYSLNKENYASNLSSKDINTMNMLYNTEADISNSLPLSMSQNKEYQKYLLLANKCMLQSDYKNALMNLQLALKIYSKEYLPHFNAGICYMRLGEYLNASNEFETAKTLNTQEPLCYYNAAVAQVQLAEVNYKNDPARKRQYYLKAVGNLEAIQYKTGIPSNTSQILASLKTQI